MSAIRNKQRLIHLYRYLVGHTDEDHQVTTNDLVEYLKQEDANASRKTVKDDIEILIEEGVDIVITKSFFNSYFVGSRKFEVPEIQLLVDGILPNKTISEGKKKTLIKKLLSMVSEYQADKIRKNLHFEYCGDCRNVVNEQLYYTIDRIMCAINENRKISFAYTESVACDGVNVVLTPLMIKSEQDRYYIVGSDGESEELKVFALECVSRTKILQEKGSPHPPEASLSRFLNSLFEMESGEYTEVTLECSDELLETVRTRFGDRTNIWRGTPGNFYMKVPVSVSLSFYGWLFKYGSSIRVVAPAWVRNEYTRRAREVVNALAGD